MLTKSGHFISPNIAPYDLDNKVYLLIPVNGFRPICKILQKTDKTVIDWRDKHYDHCDIWIMDEHYSTSHEIINIETGECRKYFP